MFGNQSVHPIQPRYDTGTDTLYFQKSQAAAPHQVKLTANDRRLLNHILCCPITPPAPARDPTTQPKPHPHTPSPTQNPTQSIKKKTSPTPPPKINQSNHESAVADASSCGSLGPPSYPPAPVVADWEVGISVGVGCCCVGAWGSTQPRRDTYVCDCATYTYTHSYITHAHAYTGMHPYTLDIHQST